MDSGPLIFETSLFIFAMSSLSLGPRWGTLLVNDPGIAFNERFDYSRCDTFAEAIVGPALWPQVRPWCNCFVALLLPDT